MLGQSHHNLNNLLDISLEMTLVTGKDSNFICKAID
jgi:hypothetical protein